jgi:hypothetical protein
VIRLLKHRFILGDCNEVLLYKVLRVVPVSTQQLLKLILSRCDNEFIGLIARHGATCFGSWSHHQAVQFNIFQLLNCAITIVPKYYRAIIL